MLINFLVYKLWGSSSRPSATPSEYLTKMAKYGLSNLIRYPCVGIPIVQ